MKECGKQRERICSLQGFQKRGTTEPLRAFLCSQQRAESGGSPAQALPHLVGHRLTH